MVCKYELSHGKIRLSLFFISFNLSNEGATSFGDEYSLCHLMSEQCASKMEIVALVLLKFVLNVQYRKKGTYVVVRGTCTKALNISPASNDSSRMEGVCSFSLAKHCWCSCSVSSVAIHPGTYF